MGIGQGNFYRLSDIASFSKSHFLILNHGENAHNYFLQTLTETGLVGVAVFVFVLLAPLYSVNDKRILIPGAIAILSLFLGNIFSHSFLVRENLLLTSTMLGLIYVAILIRLENHGNSREVIEASCASGKIKLVILACLTLTTMMSFDEVHKSFNKPPFEYGRFCFMDAPLTHDFWTAGNYNFGVLRISEASKTFSLINPRPRDNDMLIAEFSAKPILGESQQEVLLGKVTFGVKENTLYPVNFFKMSPEANGSSYRILMSLTNCYTPRNLGDNLDSRRLGIKILEPLE